MDLVNQYNISYLVYLSYPLIHLFCFLSSVYRGYYEGNRNMLPTAFSNVIDALSKLVFGFTTALIVVKLSGLMFILGFILAGLDFRFGWSNMPTAVTVIASVIFIISYGLYAEVMRENAYLSRTIEVQENQKVVDTGLYSIVRHPMYAVTVVLFLAIPLILGSWWAFLIFLPYPAIIAVRIINEEKVLSEQLEGYEEYKKECEDTIKRIKQMKNKSGEQVLNPFSIFFFTIFATIHFFIWICQLEDLVEFLFDRSDTSGVAAFDDIFDLLGKNKLLFGNNFTVFNHNGTDFRNGLLFQIETGCLNIKGNIFIGISIFFINNAVIPHIGKNLSIECF